MSILSSLEQGSGTSVQRVLLVCSPGGHLIQLLSLESAWSSLEIKWVSLESPDVSHLLPADDTIIAHGPTNRSVRAFARNIVLAWEVVREFRPDVVISTGAALAVPFFYVGRLHGASTVYVESLTRVEGLSLTGKLVYPVSHDFLVQWPEATRRRRARFRGSVL